MNRYATTTQPEGSRVWHARRAAFALPGGGGDTTFTVNLPYAITAPAYVWSDTNPAELYNRGSNDGLLVAQASLAVQVGSASSTSISFTPSYWATQLLIYTNGAALSSVTLNGAPFGYQTVIPSLLYIAPALGALGGTIEVTLASALGVEWIVFEVETPVPAVPLPAQLVSVEQPAAGENSSYAPVRSVV